jgi:hypothetical protein
MWEGGGPSFGIFLPELSSHETLILSIVLFVASSFLKEPAGKFCFFFFFPFLTSFDQRAAGLDKHKHKLTLMKSQKLLCHIEPVALW